MKRGECDMGECIGCDASVKLKLLSNLILRRCSNAAAAVELAVVRRRLTSLVSRTFHLVVSSCSAIKLIYQNKALSSRIPLKVYILG